jgi:thiol:disulfide interchange protein
MKLKLVILLFCLTGLLFSQIISPVKWKTSIKELQNQEFEALISAKIEKPWHLYSKDLNPNSGIPTEVNFKPNPHVQLIGKLTEKGNQQKVFSEAFKTELLYYSDDVFYIQKFKVLDASKEQIINIEVYYQVCDDKMCLAPESELLQVKIPAKVEAKTDNLQKKDAVKNSIIEQKKAEKIINNQLEEKISTSLLIPSIDLKNPKNSCAIQDNHQNEKSYLKLAILGFLGGLLALLTPCVFPMIPLTVSFFTKSKDSKKGKKNALIYALLIVIIFALLSIPFHLFESINSDVFNQISTNIGLNLFFFAVFIVFAFSFFGYFELTLPSWIANKTDQAANKTGFVGLFFMALTLVIVSFSCTGPILGSLLAGAISNTNGAWQLTFALIGFGLSWSLIFGGFALFPQVLSSLPKSGNWMNTTKVILGFLEVALALKFLSKADLVAKTNLINREFFIAIWILIFVLLLMYLLGKIRFPHDEKQVQLSFGRKLFAGLIFLFVIYLGWGIIPSKEVRLKALSGILPPAHLSFFKKDSETCPLNLACLHDYHQAIQLSKQTGKPILLDFTGYGCENCRKMEEFVWSEPEVFEILNEKLIIVSLYVDDKELLPTSEQIIVTLKNGKQRQLETIGDKWSVFQQENFNSNSQPQYILLNSNEELLNFPLSGYVSKEEFLNFLNCGLK